MYMYNNFHYIFIHEIVSKQHNGPYKNTWTFHPYKYIHLLITDKYQPYYVCVQSKMLWLDTQQVICGQ